MERQFAEVTQDAWDKLPNEGILKHAGSSPAST